MQLPAAPSQVQQSRGSAALPCQVANHTISILLGLVYCIIQPVMAPLVLAYFLISLFIAKCVSAQLLCAGTVCAAPPSLLCTVTCDVLYVLRLMRHWRVAGTRLSTSCAPPMSPAARWAPHVIIRCHRARS